MVMLTRVLSGLFLTVSRLFLIAWSGGAALFVISSIAEQRIPELDSMAKDRLAAIRFPLYYAFGAVCLCTATVSIGLTIVTTQKGRRKYLVAGFLLCLISAAVASYDYVAVYSPLLNAITPPGQVRGPDFVLLHEKSALVNEIHISIAFLAAILISLPDLKSRETT